MARNFVWFGEGDRSMVVLYAFHSSWSDDPLELFSKGVHAAVYLA
jgi:hypothetical protein